MLIRGKGKEKALEQGSGFLGQEFGEEVGWGRMSPVCYENGTWGPTHARHAVCC